MYGNIHLHTHVSVSSTYVSLVRLPVSPPNTTALRWSILVNVWPHSGGGLSPVVGWTAHTPARTVTEQKYVSLSGPLAGAVPHTAMVMCRGAQHNGIVFFNKELCHIGCRAMWIIVILFTTNFYHDSCFGLCCAPHDKAML